MSKERLGELEDLFEDISNDMRPPYVGVSLDTIVDVKWLIKYAKEQTERVQELEKLCKQLIGEEWMNDEGLYDSEMMKLEKENQRYKQALELVEDELEYAKTTGNDEVRDMYIKNSIRFINEALEREG